MSHLDGPGISAWLRSALIMGSGAVVHATLALWRRRSLNVKTFQYAACGVYGRRCLLACCFLLLMRGPRLVAPQRSFPWP